MIAQRRALKVTINIIKALTPIIMRLLKQVQEAKDPKSDGGKEVTPEERWEIAYNASVVFLPEIVDAITEAIE